MTTRHAPYWAYLVTTGVMMFGFIAITLVMYALGFTKHGCILGGYITAAVTYLVIAMPCGLLERKNWIKTIVCLSVMAVVGALTSPIAVAVFLLIVLTGPLVDAFQQIFKPA